tara:strand:+ start:1089 stop:1475 length:387 start_codon:yes stop_codon:yes gene_type:complete
MAHFAKLGVGDIVLEVHAVSNDIVTSEQAGIEFLQKLHRDRAVWKQTSYNTREGQHLLGGTPLRKNYAGKGFQYDSTRDAFIPPKPYNSWIFNETTCVYDPPVARPNNTDIFSWNEDGQSWDLVDSKA